MKKSSSQSYILGYEPMDLDKTKLVGRQLSSLRKIIRFFIYARSGNLVGLNMSKDISSLALRNVKLGG